MLTVVSAATADYSRPWVFPSLGMLHTARLVCLLHPADARPLPRGAERVPYDTPGVHHQDGRFLDAIPKLSERDVVVLADADGVFQRDFSPDEMRVLDDLGDHGFALGYNARPGQKGEEEHELLRPRQSLEETAARMDLPTVLLRGCRVYNTGFMCGRASAWRRLRQLYAQTVGGVDGGELFRIWSWPQYFICLTLSRHGIPVTELGPETHSHGHFPLTPRHLITRRQLTYCGQLVLFAHNVMGVSH